MGLNPPFGVKASLANKFIDKALEFQPKLLILIVPEVTQGLDKKLVAYDLVWEDDRILSGKSFYLPGSVDVREKQLEDWNLKPPLLYLWSRPDWTDKHKAIAQFHRHISNEQENYNDYLVENHDFHRDFLSSVEHACGNISGIQGGFLEIKGQTKQEGTRATQHEERSSSETSLQGKLNVDLYAEAEESCINMILSPPDTFQMNSIDLKPNPSNEFKTETERAQNGIPIDLQNRHTVGFSGSIDSCFGSWNPSFAYSNQSPFYPNGSVPNQHYGHHQFAHPPFASNQDYSQTPPTYWNPPPPGVQPRYY